MQNAHPMDTPVRLAWLFDLDGTLLSTHGAALEAYREAVHEIFGGRDDLKDIAFAGRIDTQILADILAKYRTPAGDEIRAKFWDAVLRHMTESLHPGRGALLPGVPALLDAVDREPTWVPTLLTGNMAAMAMMKLRHYGIERRFTMGAFGDEAMNRDELARLAVQRIGERYGVPPERCIVLGDTVHDIACARAAGAHIAAVATGPNPREMLEALAPELLLADLTDTRELLEWARGIAAG